MKRNLVCLFHLLLFIITGQAQTNMFRGGPSHPGTASSGSNQPLTEPAWQFAAGGPIRSTVVCDDQSIFFGAADGIFYCLNKNTGTVNWTLKTGKAIHSSAAVDDKAVYFANNKQMLFAVDKHNGKIIWQHGFEANKSYDWAFDYFYSSPTLVGNNLLIGARDGYLYNINNNKGTVVWKFKVDGIVRSSPAVKDNVVYVGDTEGTLYALQLTDGKQQWIFRTEGYKLNNTDFGFDRKAIISSPAVSNTTVFVGGRDGFLYAVDRASGKEVWRVNHEVSWVISSPAVKDSVVITGTSDGHFVQAVNSVTGKELWKYRTAGIVWSSPLICNDKVYIGSNEGALYCLDLQSGKRLSSYQTGGKIWASPVVADTLLFIGNDKGRLYALKPSAYSYKQSTAARKAVFYEPGVYGYFKKSIELKTKEFLNGSGFASLDSKQLAAWMQKSDSAAGSVVVFATDYFPADITKNNGQSILRSYLANGGRIVILGNNPAIFDRDTTTKEIRNFNFSLADSILGIHYAFPDLRSMKGIQPAFPTAEGKRWGLPAFWTGFLPLPSTEVDVVLGFDENGLASAWVKKYSSHAGSGLVQIWVDQEAETDLNFILRAAEHGLE